MCFRRRKKAAPVEETPVVQETDPGESASGEQTDTLLKTTPDEAAKEQERLAAEQLKQQRIARSREKQTLLGTRLERMAEYGSGQKVLTGKEKQLSYKYDASMIAPASGKRTGTGRRSLITGSAGGIGYYSRFL